jgi:hypothetical protein
MFFASRGVCLCMCAMCAQAALPKPNVKITTDAHPKGSMPVNGVIPPVPTLPTDWTAYCTSELLQNFGNFVANDGALCCQRQTNCAVQYQFGAGMEYYDYTNNRTRIEQEAGMYMLSLYNESTDFLVNKDGTCSSQCPMDSQDTQQPDFFTGTNMSYNGQLPFNGKMYDTWTWVEETIIGPIMTVLAYFDTSVTPYIPIEQIGKLNPNIQEGVITTTTEGLKWGTPDPSFFVCKGCDNTCPTGQCQNNVNSPFARLRALRRRQRV